MPIINKLTCQELCGVLDGPWYEGGLFDSSNQKIFRVAYTVAIHWHRGEGVSVMGCCGHRYFTCTEQHIRHSRRWCRKKWLHRRSKSAEKVVGSHCVVHFFFIQYVI